MSPRNLSSRRQNRLLWNRRAFLEPLESRALLAVTTFTLDADFDQGTLFNTNHSPSNQVQLNSTLSTFPVMWIANTGEDTLSKIDSNTGAELARYRTWFGGEGANVNGYGNPSRTAVDSEGNVYIANRHFDGRPANVLKILAEGGIDRNNNGVIDTSFDADNSGTIDLNAETLPMSDLNNDGILTLDEVQDERVVWVSAPIGSNQGYGRSLTLDVQGNVWLGLYNDSAYYKLDANTGAVIGGPISTNTGVSATNPNGEQHNPYGSVVDANGILWGASLGNTLLKLDTNTNAVTVYDHSQFGSDYGIAIGNGKVYQASLYGFTYIEFDPVTETFSTPAARQFYATGIAVDSQGNIVVGRAGNGDGVAKFRPDGSLLWEVNGQPGSSGPHGTVVDANDDVWTVNFSNNISKFRGVDGAPLGVFPVGQNPYTYSDVTGVSRFNNTSPSGTWRYVKDSGMAGTLWGTLTWNTEDEAYVPEGGEIRVEVRTADTTTDLANATFEAVASGVPFDKSGRYLEVRVTLKASPAGESPVLSDLSITDLAIDLDFGDAPASYGTLSTDDGARHLAVGPQLGLLRDSEQDGQPDTFAQGDDRTADDEEGVVLPPALVPGAAASVTVTASASGLLDAWIDFNRDGEFTAEERLFASRPLAPGANLLPLAVPASAVAGTSFARFRLSTAGGLSPTGSADDGEVEDYAVQIVNCTTGGASLIDDYSLGGKALLVCGTSNSDAIAIRPATQPGVIEVRNNPFVGTSYFAANALGRIMIIGKAGNDSIAIDSRLTYPTLLYGEAGNDSISGGSGPDVIYGGEGTDSLAGNAGDDQLFGEAGADRLYGGAGFDTFTESGAGAFVLSASQLTIAGVSHTLSGLERAILQGSTGGDSFHVGAWPGTGMIDGLGGTDKLLAAGDVNFTLTNSQLTRSVGGAFALVSIEEAELTGGFGNNTLDASGFGGRLKLDGGAGNDLLKSGAGPALLLGGAGNDLLQGGAGRTVQIGGLGADTLLGGGDDDLLIGGTTSYDTNAAALLAILNEWVSSASYATRVAHLKGTLAGGLNGAYKLTSTTVRSDTHVDTLTGGGGLDWFFAKLANPYADMLTDRALDETVN